MLTNVATIIFMFSINVCIAKRYSNYTLYRAIPVNNSHLDFFSNLNDFYDVNFWRAPGLVYKPVDFVINPHDQPTFVRDAERHGVYLTTIIDDVQKAFDQQTVKAYIRRNMDSFDWNNYFRLDDIYHWLKDLAKAHPKVVQLQSIGQSYENRDIMSIRIAFQDSENLRSTIIIEGGIHAREWIAPAVVTYLIHEILHANHSKDDLLKKVANTYEWYFVPVLNVDGYEYTHTIDRLWRKNRHGFGVDLNRNFGHAFGSAGVSRMQKSDLYCGEEAFSEKESKAMADFVKTKSKKLEYYIALHSYGQYMILPYADSKKHQDNFDEVANMCHHAADKIQKRYHTKYTIGTASDTVGYFSSGVSGCWVKSTYHVPFVVTFELRDNGCHGFALPPQLILETCKETLDGLVDLFSPRITTKNKFVPGGLSGRTNEISEILVIVFNILLFIVVRFD